MNSVKDFRGKIEPPVERGVLKIERYVQRLTQGYSAHGGSYLWAPDYGYSVDLPFRLELYQKSYMCLKHRVTLRIYFHLVLWIQVGPPIWQARSHMRRTFDR